MDDLPVDNPMLVAAALVDQVLAGERSPYAVLEDWPDSGACDRLLLNHAWTALQHFADDEDLHKIDADYLAAELQRLKHHASKLRS